MAVAASVVLESIAGATMSPSEHARYRQHRRGCIACPSCRRVGLASVECDAKKRGGTVDLRLDDCPQNRWPVSILAPGTSTAGIPGARRDASQSTSGNAVPVPVPGAGRVYVYGCPGLYAGANTELHHQIILWRRMGIKVHLIPSEDGDIQEPLYPEMLERGVVVHEPDEFDAIVPGSPVFGFCNSRFLENLDRVRQFTHTTVFVNCMTWLFDLEKQRHREGKIAAFLYQNDEVRAKQQARLQAINPDHGVRYLTFSPFFDAEAFPFVPEKTRDKFRGANRGNFRGRGFTVGRISRQDADKFSADTLNIWEAIGVPGTLPGGKRGVMLGFGPASERKIGRPPPWVATYEDQRALSQQDFYAQVDVLVQPMDTTENWPRIGLEAMASGVVVIVDNRGGWRQMVEHGVTGWLCDTPEDFIRYGTRMANEVEERKAMARSARQRLEALAGEAVAASSWRSAFERLSQTAPSSNINVLGDHIDRADRGSRWA